MIRPSGPRPVFRVHEKAAQNIRTVARLAVIQKRHARRQENSESGRFPTIPWRVTIVLLWFGVTGCTQAFFQPLRGQEHTPGPLGLAYEDVWVQSADGVRMAGFCLQRVELPVR